MEGWPSGAGPRLEPAPAPLAAGRRHLLPECLVELPLQLREGDAGREPPQAAAALGCDGIVTSRAVDPPCAVIAGPVAAALPLRILAPEAFVALALAGPGLPDRQRGSPYRKRPNRCCGMLKGHSN